MSIYDNWIANGNWHRCEKCGKSYSDADGSCGSCVLCECCGEYVDVDDLDADDRCIFCSSDAAIE